MWLLLVQPTFKERGQRKPEQQETGRRGNYHTFPMASFPCHHFQPPFNHNTNLPSLNCFLIIEGQRQQGSKKGKSELWETSRMGWGEISLHMWTTIREKKSGGTHWWQRRVVWETNHFCLMIDKGSLHSNGRTALAKGPLQEGKRCWCTSRLCHLKRVEFIPLSETNRHYYRHLMTRIQELLGVMSILQPPLLDKLTLKKMYILWQKWETH